MFLFYSMACLMLSYLLHDVYAFALYMQTRKTILDQGSMSDRPHYHANTR